MLKIGITGGIGSGKTTVCKIFEVLGISVYYADDKAKQIMNKNEVLKNQVIEKFGEEVYTSTGTLNRTYLAKIVFKNAELLNTLNSLVHPYIFQDTLEWMQKHKDEKYVLYEAAIMFESGSYKMMDKTILVIAPPEDRISRVIRRDKISEKEVIERMNKQMSDEEKLKLADFKLYNDEEHELLPQILEFHKKFTTE